MVQGLFGYLLLCVNGVYFFNFMGIWFRFLIRENECWDIKKVKSNLVLRTICASKIFERSGLTDCNLKVNWLFDRNILNGKRRTVKMNVGISKRSKVIWYS